MDQEKPNSCSPRAGRSTRPLRDPGVHQAEAVGGEKELAASGAEWDALALSDDEKGDLASKRLQSSNTRRSSEHCKGPPKVSDSKPSHSKLPSPWQFWKDRDRVSKSWRPNLSASAGSRGPLMESPLSTAVLFTVLFAVLFALLWCARCPAFSRFSWVLDLAIFHF